MNDYAKQSVTFTSQEGEDFSLGNERWIKLEQPPIDEKKEKANLEDIVSMMQFGAAGLTSSLYTPSGISILRATPFAFEFTLGFWLFPSDINMGYSLQINQGVIDSGVLSWQNKTGNLVVPMQKNVVFPYLISSDGGGVDRGGVDWETPVYNEFGVKIKSPKITILESRYISFPEKVFGVLRLNFPAQGFWYNATLSFPKTKKGAEAFLGFNKTDYNNITNVNCAIICTYQDENDKTQQTKLQLKIPQITQDLLAECPDESLLEFPPCQDLKYNTRTVIYYSTCTGEILDTVRTDLKDKCLEESEYYE